MSEILQLIVYVLLGIFILCSCLLLLVMIIDIRADRKMMDKITSSIFVKEEKLEDEE